MPATAVSELLAPLRLGAREAPNRIVFGPHVTNLAEAGLPGERLAAYYARRAAGGAGVLVLEETQVHTSSHPYQRAVQAAEPGLAGAWRRLAERVRPAAAGRPPLLLAQLSHAGMQGTGHIRKRVLWAPSAVANPATLEMPKVMEAEDVEAVVSGFAAAAALAKEAGLDGVEVNAGQRSLVRQFLSGLTNLRDDEWGGDAERRLRFPLAVLKAVRLAAGPDLVVGLRLCADELAPWAGITPAAAPGLAAALAGGVDYVSVVVGSIYSLHATRAGLHEPPGYALGTAAAVRAALAPRGVAVLATGSLVDPGTAAAALAGGSADAAEMTRALIADPELPRKLEAGRPETARPCIRCNQDCAVLSAANATVSCIHNPEAGYEAGWPGLTAAARPAALLVVGGGPAGMEAARVAALRGHRITLVERSSSLGGTPLLVAAGWREPFGLVSGWLAARLAELPGVAIRLGEAATPARVVELCEELGCVEVVLATGARPRPADLDAPLPGASLPHVLSAREALAGPGPLPGTGRVAVLDRQGSYPAVDAARLAAAGGRPVVLVSEDPFCSSGLGATGELTPWYQAAAALGIELRALTSVLEIEPRALLVRHRHGGPATRERLAADCVVVADHELAEDGLWRALAAPPAGGPALPAGVRMRRVGDCLAPRRVLQAILEGGRAGTSL